MSTNVHMYASLFIQGEDRWLCSLLIEHGYKIEYCAISDSFSYSPESFGEFFNQRRRWIGSDLCNNAHLVRTYSIFLCDNNLHEVQYWF